MGLGRLTPEKGFDLLIEAFARIAPAWPMARLVIWGEGDERARLEAIRARLDLVDRVELPGATRSPERELRSATIFVLSSRLEGLPMVLLEAMAVGRPVVACDCDYGPRDIIRPGVDGLLVPPEDVPALAEAIDGLLRDDERRGTLGRRAVEVRERFAIEAISDRWDALFQEARAGR
jgi:glycosyltransferase involved in cell wall biosynthesis